MTRTTSPLLRLRLPTGLRVGGRRLLSPLTFEWRAGENWGVSGPNASGKTSLFRLLTGDIPLPPDAEIAYGFRARDGADPSSRVALISLERQAETLAALDVYAQMRWNSTEDDATPTLADWLSYEAVENIGPYEIRNISPTQRAAFERRRTPLLRALRLDPLLKRRVAQLSNGEARRAFLARALLTRPRLLLLDEPLAGLDDESRILAGRLLERLARSHTTALAIASLHDRELPPFLSRRLRLGKPDGASPPRTPRRTRSLGKPPPLPGRPLVAMRSLRIAYGDHVVFDHFNWKLHPGERWLLTGPNGSGKSTLLALITGDHLQAYANNIRLFGRRRGSGESIWDIKRRIGWVSPELHLAMDPTQSVLETVLSGFNDTPLYIPTDTPSRRRAAETLLRRAGLWSRRDDPFGTLASGEQRFALLARAMVKRPPLLILDEPCQLLDAAHRARFHALLGRLLDETRAALVYTTHIPGDVPPGITHRLRLGPGGAVIALCSRHGLGKPAP